MLYETEELDLKEGVETQKRLTMLAIRVEVLAIAAERRQPIREVWREVYAEFSEYYGVDLPPPCVMRHLNKSMLRVVADMPCGELEQLHTLVSMKR